LLNGIGVNIGVFVGTVISPLPLGNFGFSNRHALATVVVVVVININININVNTPSK
jgi:hypothetical protein